MTNPDLFPKGTILVGFDGGSAQLQLPAGLSGTALTIDDTQPTGLAWAAVGNGSVVGPGSSTTHNLASFADTTGALLEDSGIARATVALGIGSSTDDRLARFNGTSGVQLDQAAGTTLSDTDKMLFPANGGTVYTAGSTKGSFTFNGSGTHTKILTANAVTGCLIVFTVVSLGTVTAAQAILATIDTGVGFTPVSADATDASVVNWAIVA
jgi:hypothetical protein